jgi:glyoxylase-like metal-dependent hydrolase (beta-lactamase superfamily II)
LLIELTKHIKLIRPERKAAFPYSNSLFIDDEVQAVIDAGSGGRAYADVPLGKIELLLLTHHHFDHINGISFFSNAKKLAGEEELWAFQDEAKFIEAMGYHRWPELMGSPYNERTEKDRKFPDDVPSRPGFQAIHIAGVFHHNEIIKFGETSVQAIHTPGHSPGHYSFFFPEERILFAGDLDATRRGPWYGGEFSDLDDIIQSIYKLIALKPQILVSSHRRVLDSKIEDILLAYLDIALQREANILNYLTEPRTVNDIADQNFINEWEQMIQRNLFFHKMMIIKHLKRMEKNGMAIKTPDNKYIRA